MAAALVAAPLLVSGCGLPVLPAGALTTQELEVPEDVTAVRLEGRGSVELTEGPASLQVSAGRNLLADVDVRAVGDELVLSMSDSGAFSRRGRVTYRLTLPAWDGVAASGSGDVRTTGDAGTGPLRVVVSGSGAVVARDVDRDAIEVTVAGSGEAVLSGRAAEQRVVVAGSGSVDASALEGREVEVEVSGSGDAAVTASESLEARVSGSGDVVWSGAATDVQTFVTGSGDVHQQ